MGHEKFLKIFYEPQNVFLCYFLFLTSFEKSFENLSGFEQQMSKLAIKRI